MRQPLHFPKLPAGRSTGRAHPGSDPSASQSKVSLILGKARLQRARPAQPLKPGYDLGVIQARVVAAVTANELEHAGVATFRPAVHHPDWLAPQDRPKAVASLASGRGRRGISAWLQAAGMAGSGRACGTCRMSWRGPGGHKVHVRPAHLALQMSFHLLPGSGAAPGAGVPTMILWPNVTFDKSVLGGSGASSRCPLLATALLRLRLR